MIFQLSFLKVFQEIRKLNIKVKYFSIFIPVAIFFLDILAKTPGQC